MFRNSTEYVIRGLAELVARESPDPVMIDELVNGTGLPRDFLAKLFQQLARAGIVQGVRGRGGGFMLAKRPEDVTLMDVVEAIEGKNTYDRCVVGLDRCNDQMPCAQHDLYKPVRQQLKNYLNSTTLADLSKSLQAKPAWQALRLQRPSRSAARNEQSPV
jgi:Rrf2 family iron-sulfur cluster assembly transcriptional regulator